MPLFEVEAVTVEPVFHKLYSYIFDLDNSEYSAKDNDRPVPNAIFLVNFDKVWFSISALFSEKISSFCFLICI